jgi:hypothetical protein
MTFKIPPELLFEILAEVVSSYIDRAITTPPVSELREFYPPLAVKSAYNPVSNDLEISNDPVGDLAAVLDEEQTDTITNYGPMDDEEIEAWEKQETEEPLAENPILALLSVSQGFRAVTLQILEVALAIEIDSKGR